MSGKKGQKSKKPKCLMLPKEKKEASESIMDIMYEGNGPFKSELVALIKSRTAVFSLQTNEEKRFVAFMEHFSRCKNIRLYVWDMISGLKWVDNNWDSIDMDNQYTRNCTTEHERVLAYIHNEHTNMQKAHAKEYKDRGYKADVYILFDFQHMLKEPRIIRRLKHVSDINSVMSSILVGEEIVKNHFSDEMFRLIPNIDAPSPGDEELMAILDDMVAGVKTQVPDIEEQIKNNKKEILKKMRGKTLLQAQRLICMNLVNHKKILGE